MQPGDVIVAVYYYGTGSNQSVQFGQVKSRGQKFLTVQALTAEEVDQEERNGMRYTTYRPGLKTNDRPFRLGLDGTVGSNQSNYREFKRYDPLQPPKVMYDIHYEY